MRRKRLISVMLALILTFSVVSVAVAAPQPMSRPGQPGGGPPGKDSPKPSYVALGDSLAVGMGALRGYVPRYRDKLVERFYPQGVNLTNLGQNGWKSQDLLNALRGNRKFRNAVSKAHIVTMNIGGNDLLAIREDPDGLGQAALEKFTENFPAILAEIRNLNPTAQLYTMDIYSLDYADEDPEHEWVIKFNEVIWDAAGGGGHHNVTGVAEVYEAFRGKNNYISIDGVHPNDVGHEAIAKELDKVTSEPVFAQLSLASGM